MFHTAPARRTASALGAAAVLGVVLAAPAMARPDPGTGGPGFSSSNTSQFPHGLDRQQREGNPTGVDRDRQLGGFTTPGERSLGTANEVSKPSPVIVFRDNDAIDYIQVGAGVLAGIALAGAGAAILSRRNHRGLTPA